eukprot:TRINITY_DN1746_c0_g1_i2.p1 TRINITY_DN1746_c0_g1~~TRINITY_DN1746_c0_g1_i2.p1  ORF type:complete len:778 (-),score=176.68 TRINITY_DN1746_c0_g1_i2:96-2114(-)
MLASSPFESTSVPEPIPFTPLGVEQSPRITPRERSPSPPAHSCSPDISQEEPIFSVASPAAHRERSHKHSQSTLPAHSPRISHGPGAPRTGASPRSLSPVSPRRITAGTKSPSSGNLMPKLGCFVGSPRASMMDLRMAVTAASILRIEFTPGCTTIRRNPKLNLAAVLQVLLAKKDIHVDFRPDLCYFTLPDSKVPIPMETTLGHIDADTITLRERADVEELKDDEEDGINMDEIDLEINVDDAGSGTEEAAASKEVEEGKEPRKHHHHHHRSVSAFARGSLEEVEHKRKHSKRGGKEEKIDAPVEGAHTVAKNSEVKKKTPEEKAKEEKQKREEYRKHIIAELIQTETTYVNNIKLTVELFIKPIDKAKLLTKDETLYLFSTLDLMLPFNEALLEALKKPEEDIGGAFLRLKSGQYLKLIEFYCANYTASHKILAKKMDDPRFVSFLAEVYENSRLKGLTLADYLIMPMQRLCRYPLLLKDLLKHTDESSPQCGSIKTALDAILSIVASTNEFKGAEDNTKKLLEFQEKIDNGTPQSVLHQYPISQKLAMPGRKFIREDKVQELRAGQLHYVVTSDLIVRAKAYKNDPERLKLLSVIPLISLLVEDSEPIRPKKDGVEYQAFTLFYVGHKRHTLLFDTPATKEKLFSALQALVSGMVEKSYKKFKQMPKHN